MEVGLTYLAGENPGLLAFEETAAGAASTAGAAGAAGVVSAATNLTLQLMPLKRADIDTIIYIQDGHWPDFDGKDTVLAIDAIDVLRFSGTTLVAV
jgi:hypothetical protein